MCEHKYVHFDCKKREEYSVTTGMTEWTRIDYFFCEKCLDIKHINTTKSFEDEE
jgi:hypothetical protein